jgi:hypothetical protein
MTLEEALNDPDPPEYLLATQVDLWADSASFDRGSFANVIWTSPTSVVWTSPTRELRYTRDGDWFIRVR